MTRFSFMLIAIVCSGISACIAFAGEDVVDGATIRGEVIEFAKKNNPIEGATVKIVNSDGDAWTVKTDAKGKYEFTGLTAGRYTPNVSKRGYRPRVVRSKVVAPGGEIYVRIKMAKKDNAYMHFAEGLLQHVTGDIGTRYNLETSKVKALHQSIVDVLDNVLEHKNLNVDEFASTDQTGSSGLIIAMLSHPDCQAVFAKFLTEMQLQDYIDFLKARQIRIRQAAAQFMTAVLDQTLSLTVNQRKHIAKLLLDTISNKPEFALMDILGEPIPQGIVTLIHNELEVSLDSVLNQTQTKICYVMIDYYDGKDIVGIETFEPQPGKIVEKDEPDKDTPKSQEWILTEAILMAHTKRLGSLNESASKRIKLVTNGVVQQYIETQKPDTDEMSKFSAEYSALMTAVLMQNISREEGIKGINALKKEHLDESATDKQWDGTELHNITNHPLYQQAIKDVLSEDAYLEYKARQAERENFRIQASRDLILAYIDGLLLPNETQIKQLKITSDQLTISSLNQEELQLRFAELLIRMDPTLLRLLQQGLVKGGR